MNEPITREQMLNAVADAVIGKLMSCKMAEAIAKTLIESSGEKPHLLTVKEMGERFKKVSGGLVGDVDLPAPSPAPLPAEVEEAMMLLAIRCAGYDHSEAALDVMRAALSKQASVFSDLLTVHWEGDVRLLNLGDTLSFQSEILKGLHFRLEWFGKNEIKVRAAEPPAPVSVTSEWVEDLIATNMPRYVSRAERMLREKGIEVKEKP
jgi:hypothetical protein